MRRAVGSDDLLNLSQFVSRHGRKQMMFDLAAQAARAVVNSQMVFDVPAREHLFAQEVCRFGPFQQRHALMIRCEYQCQIKPEERLLCQEKQNSMGPTQKQTKQAQKPTRVQDKKTHLNHGMRDLVTHQEFNAVNFQHKRLEQGQREEAEMLVSHRKSREPVLYGCLILRKCEWQ